MNGLWYREEIGKEGGEEQEMMIIPYSKMNKMEAEVALSPVR
jgi:hypothetical protein